MSIVMEREKVSVQWLSMVLRMALLPFSSAMAKGVGHHGYLREGPPHAIAVHHR